MENIRPLQGTLINGIVDQEEAQRLQQQSYSMPAWTLTPRQLCDVELLLNGGFSPLKGFMAQADYERVVKELRLADGTLWPIPLVLDITPQFAENLTLGQSIALYDTEGLLIAILKVTSLWVPDKNLEVEKVYGSSDLNHPGVRYILDQTGDIYLGGTLTGVRLPPRYDFCTLRQTPRQLRELFLQRGWERIIAFQTRNPMHRAHHALTLRAMRQFEANLLIHPSDGAIADNIQHYARVRCYQSLIHHYPEQTTQLALLPLAMRMAGPREALWHGIIRQNYGCTHMIVGRDHAGPTFGENQQSFYAPYAAQELFAHYQSELDLQMIPMQEMVYVSERKEYVPVNEVTPEQTVQKISGTELRRRFAEDLPIPEWFSFPDVVAQLKAAFPPKHQQGFTVLLTGLPSAGKTTLAHALHWRLMELGGRRVSVLDGDSMRKILSSELGFSKTDREKHMLRTGYVAREITKHGGIAILALIAPLQKIRRQLRDIVTPFGGFIEVYINTPQSICEQRDRKGLYKKARQGLIENFTGVSSEYEIPKLAELVIDTSNEEPNVAIQQIILKLQHLGYLGGGS
ncbi:MAG: bifunctional sulfate adenylyltransferase/adenylylsulfate kinase [Gammaproteobacteria bacterium]|nr:bifunctional sulfate adenylyltransferase/adenylylsulfate kinase [Gammaproteobacteria bacterium]